MVVAYNAAGKRRLCVLIMAKVQFNPSTLKASYLVANKTAQTVAAIEAGDDCGYCNANETPEQIKVVFENIVACPDCEPFGNHWREWDILVNNINGVEFTLTQKIDNACYWYYLGSLSTGEFRWYLNSDCTNLDSTYTFSYIEIHIVKDAADKIWILGQISIVGAVFYAFFRYHDAGGNGLTTTLGGCVGATEVANVMTSCFMDSPYWGMCEDGTTTITEIWS